MQKLTKTFYSVALMFLMLFNFCGGVLGEGEKEMKQLPDPLLRGEMSVEAAITARRSIRSFSESALNENEISQLLWAAQGITEPKRGLRTAPSAGATYPLETYIVMEKGVFRYIPDKHALEPVKSGDIRPDLSKACMGQICVRQASITIVFAAVSERITSRYGERAEMYTHMEAGHAAQNIHLQAVALGLGSVPVGAFQEAAAKNVLGIPDDQKLIYMVPVGRLK